MSLKVNINLEILVRAKKHLGQHFLKDEEITKSICDLYKNEDEKKLLLEVGPGMGVLTKYLLKREDFHLKVVEIDKESVEYLEKNFENLHGNIISDDFLELDLLETLELETDAKFGLIGNFPYNISSQIFFKVLDYKDNITEVVGMLQKEVARRLASKPKNKEYGILSVLLQAYFDIEYCFTVPPHVFVPPPKVESGVIRLVRNNNKELGCDYKKFKLVIKTGFNQRRKMLSNALKPLGVHFEHPFLSKRAEELSYQDFVLLTNLIFPPK